ncbi:ADP-ribosylation/Crystallin J1 [Phytophthora palmivora]|uniref:ADP-ribosylation/Crystallin J1 n=1 Tax=Phytophthora palmivora TaxID=4796 RepID=A0A2P4Y5E2_9STRA|nr:ADP-ribosylation/Crystallin J1 [Phytophthora palmivora]
MSLTTKQRALAAVAGGFVADAATMGLHWIYDGDKMKELAAARGSAGPEFYEPPSCPFYSYESGALSPYGDEIFPLLQDVADRGEFVPEEFAMTSYHAAKAYTGRLNSVFKEMVVKGDAGKKYPDLASPSKDLHGGIKTPILVARYAGDTPLLLQKTREATRVHEIGAEAEDAAVATALLIQQVVQGVSIPDAIKALTSNDAISADTRASVHQVIDAVEAKTFQDATTAVAHFGKPCSLPGVLQGSVFVLLTSGSYVEALRANMLAGGDNCSRSIVIGAVFAAAQGSDGIPAEWKQKTKVYEKVQALADKIVQ